MDSTALQSSLKNLDTAFKNSFDQPNLGFPKFKSKKTHRHSIQQNTRMEYQVFRKIHKATKARQSEDKEQTYPRGTDCECHRVPGAKWEVFRITLLYGRTR